MERERERERDVGKEKKGGLIVMGNKASGSARGSSFLSCY